MFCNFCRSLILTKKIKDFYTFTFLCSTFMSVGWDVKWCRWQGIQPLCTQKSVSLDFDEATLLPQLMRDARETTRFQNWSHLTKSRRCYMAEILPIRCKTQCNQSIYTWSMQNSQQVIFSCLLPVRLDQQ